MTGAKARSLLSVPEPGKVGTRLPQCLIPNVSLIILCMEMCPTAHSEFAVYNILLRASTTLFASGGERVFLKRLFYKNTLTTTTFQVMSDLAEMQTVFS